MPTARLPPVAVPMTVAVTVAVAMGLTVTVPKQRRLLVSTRHHLHATHQHYFASTTQG